MHGREESGVVRGSADDEFAHAEGVFNGFSHIVTTKVGNAHLSPAVSYSVSQNNNWRSMVIHMDGNPSTASGWSGDFNGFRLDWSSNTGYGEYMEIADFLFFANGNDATAFSAALNTLDLAIPDRAALHDGSYFSPITSGENYTTIWAEELNGMIVDSELATHKFTNLHGVPFVRLAVLQKSDVPYVELNIAPQDADEYKFVNLLVRTDITTNPAFALYFADENGEYSDDRVGISRYSSSANWQVITLNFTELSSWSGDISKLRLDFLCGGPYYSVGTGCDIVGISFCRDAEAVYDSAYEMSVKAYNPVQVLDNFSDSDIQYFQNNDTEGNTAITTGSGNLIYTATGTGDPQKTFKYESYANAHGLKAVTTDVFQYTVIRYRSQGLSSSQMSIELYYLTGDAKGLWDMAGYNYTDENGKLHYSIHRTNAGYQATTTWKTTVFNMAKTDGMAGADKLLNGWHREDGNTRFQGFRFDWCASANIGAFFEVSDFIFFVDQETATAFSSTINAVTIPQSMKDPEINPEPDDGDLPFEDEETTTEIPDIDTEDTDLPEYPDGEETEEEIPTFPNEDEDDIPVEDDSDIIEDTDGEDDTETETERDTDDVAESEENEPDETENDPPKNTETETFPDISGGIDVGGEPEDKGSEVPFLVACILLACLSVASIVTVIVIRMKSKKAN